MIKESIKKKRYMIWYGLCALFLGIIDQRRGSASGNVQMIFANLVGVAVFMLLLPSLKKEFFQCRGVKLWGCISTAALIVFILTIKSYVHYWGQWNAAVLSGVCVATLVIYILWDRKEIFGVWRISRVGFGIVMLSLLLMLLSINRTVWPGFYMLLFGCFYLIGIPRALQDEFMEGILGGLALWFVGQQCIAFGFRPYDYIRYRGLYLGETQNGLFYMTAFLAFTGLWLYARKKERKKIWQFCCFTMAAGCGSLLLLTGGRSSFLGLVVGTFVGYLQYDIVMCKSFKHWIPQGILTGVCILLLFPAAYGCVRYLPTVLHHPVWFEGEYNEDRCVRSFDPWDSERYVTFDRATNRSLGRLLSVLDIKVKIENGKLHIQTPLSIKADAEEYVEPGSSREHPYLKDNEQEQQSGPIDPARIAIWKYFIKNLNWEGHDGDVFYYRKNRAFGNAHNMFLHVAYLYGILPGILFLVWNIWCLFRLIWRRDMVGIVGGTFMSAIMAYGMFEQATTTGQITLSLLFVLYYFGLEKRKQNCKTVEMESGRLPYGKD